MCIHTCSYRETSSSRKSVRENEITCPSCDWPVPFLIPVLDRHTHTCIHAPAVLQDADFRRIGGAVISKNQKCHSHGGSMEKLDRKTDGFFLCVYLKFHLSKLWSNPGNPVMTALQPQRSEFISSPGNYILLYFLQKVNTTCLPFCFWCLWPSHHEMHCLIKAHCKAHSKCCGFSNVFDEDCLPLGLLVSILRACAVVWNSLSSKGDCLLLVERKDLCSNLDYHHGVKNLADMPV